MYPRPLYPRHDRTTRLVREAFADEFQTAIDDGRLPAGVRAAAIDPRNCTVPPAQHQHGTSPPTQLEARGQVEARPQSGCFSPRPIAGPAANAATPLRAEQLSIGADSAVRLTHHGRRGRTGESGHHRRPLACPETATPTRARLSADCSPILPVAARNY